MSPARHRQAGVGADEGGYGGQRNGENWLERKGDNARGAKYRHKQTEGWKEFCVGGVEMKILDEANSISRRPRIFFQQPDPSFRAILLLCKLFIYNCLVVS